MKKVVQFQNRNKTGFNSFDNQHCMEVDLIYFIIGTWNYRRCMLFALRVQVLCQHRQCQQSEFFSKLIKACYYNQLLCLMNSFSSKGPTQLNIILFELLQINSKTINKDLSMVYLFTRKTQQPCNFNIAPTAMS